MSEQKQWDNNMSGVLFRNGKKKEGDKSPDYKGTCEIDGVKYEMAAWIRASQKGAKFMSFKFQLPRAAEAPQADAGDWNAQQRGTAPARPAPKAFRPQARQEDAAHLLGEIREEEMPF